MTTEPQGGISDQLARLALAADVLGTDEARMYFAHQCRQEGVWHADVVITEEATLPSRTTALRWLSQHRKRLRDRHSRLVRDNLVRDQIEVAWQTRDGSKPSCWVAHLQADVALRSRQRCTAAPRGSTRPRSAAVRPSRRSGDSPSDGSGPGDEPADEPPPIPAAVEADVRRILQRAGRRILAERSAQGVTR